MWTAWEPRPIEIRSELPADEAMDRLAEDVKPWIGRAPRRNVVTGKIGGRRLRVTRARGGRNSWTPTLQATVVNAPGGGCILQGTFNVAHGIRVFSTILVMGSTAFAILVGLAALGEWRSGDWATARSSLGAFAFATGLAASMVLLPTLGTRAGRADEHAIRHWLTERLECASEEESG